MAFTPSLFEPPLRLRYQELADQKLRDQELARQGSPACELLQGAREDVRRAPCRYQDANSSSLDADDGCNQLNLTSTSVTNAISNMDDLCPACGSKFLEDSLFCCRCGRRRWNEAARSQECQN
eukprot:TRINITY_DN8446_c1_g1_i1.p1 TRINITY_DN8446_c1_g1~~TRINITY_DN8446_c1_g1_i1.p1  ORF type:complete len:123 (+),score=17.61 TRINITY_DN8446_c1_g1_i1:370-738(+)